MIYLTYPDINKCISVLHKDDLWEQILYCYDLYNIFTTNAVNENLYVKKDIILWKHYQPSLIKILALSCLRYIREFEDACSDILEEIQEEEYWDTIPHFMLEEHLYSKHLFLSYKAFLLRKRFDYYSNTWKKLSKKLDKCPNTIFSMVQDNNSNKDNKKWIKLFGGITKNGKYVAGKYFDISSKTKK